MNLKSFKTFLNEMPLPIGHEPEEFDSKAGKYSSAKIIKAFEQIGIKIGKGSSRIAFKVAVEASQFDPNVLKKYGYHPTGSVETVFKLALNPKGIAQNKAEIENSNKAMNYGNEQYLLPILDTSTRNKKYVYADEELSNWIQMPLAPNPSKQQMNKMFDVMYGTNVFLHFRGERRISNARQIENGDSVNNKLVVQSEDQSEAYQDFLTALEELDLGIGDLGRPANWGVWNGKLYIIDYGFDSSTMELYHGSQVANVYVDSKGEMRMNTQNVQRNRGW